MNKPHKHAELIKAWADGADIQCWDIAFQEWRNIAQPSWTDNLQYRIKLQPKIVKMYMHYDKITECVNQNCFHGNSPVNLMFNNKHMMKEHLEFTFTDGVLTSVEIVK
jgi:hypothetical protein